MNHNPQLHISSVLSYISSLSTYTLIWRLPFAYYLCSPLVPEKELLSSYSSSGSLKAKRVVPLFCKSFLKFKPVQYEQQTKANALDLNLWELQREAKNIGKEGNILTLYIPSKLYSSSICIDTINKGSSYVILTFLGDAWRWMMEKYGKMEAGNTSHWEEKCHTKIRTE